MTHAVFDVVDIDFDVDFAFGVDVDVGVPVERPIRGASLGFMFLSRRCPT